MDLKIDKYNIDNKSYLSVISKDTTIVDYQMEIINNNRELPILNINVKSINNINKFSCDITGYITLQDYLIQRDINKNDLIGIIHNIVNTIINTENYLLKKYNLVIDVENTYVNILTKEIKMLYIPIKERVNENDYELIRKFLLKVVGVAAKIDSSNPMLKEVIKYIEVQYYSLVDIKKKLEAVSNQELVSSNKVESIPSIEPRKTKNKTNTLLPYLYVSATNRKVYIDKDVFMLGRLAEAVDFAINNGAIGRVHARIEKEDDEYYLTDLSSRNGSFINGSRLAPNTKYLLSDGCEVRLANTILSFKK